MKAWEIAAYVYQADLYCPECILSAMGEHASDFTSTEEDLDVLAAERDINRQDEETFDSDDFPKVALASMLEGHEHCGLCGEEL